MEIERSVQLIASWLDAVHIESALARVENAQNISRSADYREPTPPASSPELTRAARHEAAHAVVALAGGLAVHRVRIRADASGSAEYELLQNDVVTHISLVTANLAGAALELMSDADSVRVFALAHSTDVLAARLHIEDCRNLAPDWNLSARFFAITSCCAVLSQLHRIDRVAAALGAETQISGADIRALCAWRTESW